MPGRKDAQPLAPNSLEGARTTRGREPAACVSYGMGVPLGKLVRAHASITQHYNRGTLYESALLPSWGIHKNPQKSNG